MRNPVSGISRRHCVIGIDQYHIGGGGDGDGGGGGGDGRGGNV